MNKTITPIYFFVNEKKKKIKGDMKRKKERLQCEGVCVGVGVTTS
jgi:hypothetical protein